MMRGGGRLLNLRFGTGASLPREVHDNFGLVCRQAMALPINARPRTLP
jgi:hypothetical protein